jgi:cardiolipin synthase
MDLSRWKSEQLFFSGQEYFDSVLVEIERAQKSIDVECYIFDYDSVGQKVIEALVRAVQRGVVVRVIVDGVGSSSSVGTISKILGRAGVQFHVFHPLFTRFFIPVLGTLNRRNHRKTWIFDGQVAYAGSFNISEVHATPHSKAWRDNAIRVEGESILLLCEAFEKVWTQRGSWTSRILNLEAPMSSLLVRLNDGLGKRRSYYHELLRRIKKSKERIYFGNAYFSPHLRLVVELCAAARRGVDVRILLPRKSDVFFMPWVQTTYYLALLQAGVVIHEYLPRVFHAKNYIIDDWMLLGSSNLNHRSLLFDLEADIRLTHENAKNRFLEEFQKDLQNSEVITLEAFKKTSWIRSFLARFFALFKVWI